MGKLIDLTGQKFGRLTVLERAEKRGNHYYWKCLCSCGAEKIVQGCSLRNGAILSCGCLQRENAGAANTKHGLSRSKIWGIYKAMKQRCYNLNNKRYKNYGGRGIRVCEEWKDDFLAFYNYVSQLEHFGEKGYSLDRINNDGNYEPGNVRWATASEQNRNHRRNVIVEYNGEQMTLAEAVEKSGLSRNTLNSRLKSGDTGKRLFRPIKK